MTPMTPSKKAEIKTEAKPEAKTEQKEEKKETKSKDLDNLLASLQEKFGEGAIMKLGDVSKSGRRRDPDGIILARPRSWRRRTPARQGR